MSTLAKVFVIINLVLSIVFLTLAGMLFHSQRDWRYSFEALREGHMKRIREYKSEVTKREGKISDLNAYARGKEEEVRLKDSALDSFRKDLIALRTNLAQKRQEFQLLLAEHKMVVDQIDSKDNRIRDLSTENDLVKSEREVALKDKEVAEFQVARLMQIKDDLEGDLGDLRKDYYSARTKREDLQGILDQLQEYGVNWRSLVAEGVPPPTIHGKVTAVKTDEGLVILSVGSNEKVEAGHQFTVFRGEEYVAKVVVDKVTPTWSGARIIDQQITVKEGDEASTRVGF